MKRSELLAPAGSFDALKAAINNGADAVYLGGKNFSARAFANNFDLENIKEAIKFAHLRNVKIYVTVNTLLNDFEIDNAMKLIDFYYENHVDALLIQDLGLYYLIKEKYPDFELHCSTQMHIHNLEGVKTAKKLGFKRVVIARESNLEFIKEACKQDIEIETFVHGAICVSYSGQCLMSSSSKSRSANKGMCAQCCRLRYELLDENKQKIDTDTDYLLSPKDMFLINDIPELIEAGVSSFKIEGRMKSSAYVGYVTSLYRRAIDSYYENKEFKLLDNELNNLKVLFNRNFTNDYLFNKNSLFGQKSPNHLGIAIGTTIGFHNNRIKIKLASDLSQFDGIRINDFGMIVNMLYKDGFLVNKANKGDYVEIDTDKNYSGTVYKTLDYELEKRINNIENKHMPIDLEIKIVPDEKVTVKAINYNFEYVSEIIAEKASKLPLTSENIIKQFSKLNETEYYLNNVNIDTNNSFLPVSKLNEIRRDFIKKLNEHRLNNFERKTIKTNFEYKTINYDFNENDLVEENNSINNIGINYVINRESKYINDNRAVISEFGGLLKEYDYKIAYYTLNCFNSYCFEFLMKLGFNKIIISSEIKENELEEIIKRLKERLNLDIKPYIFKKGDRALMYIKANPFEKYIINDNKYYLTDGTNTYKIKYLYSNIELLEDFNNNLDINKHTLTFIRKAY